MDKYHSVSLALKILFLFLIIIIPIYFIGTSLYLNGKKAIFKEVASSALSQVNLYANTLENEFDSIKKLQYECINDEDTLYLANAYSILDNFEKAQYTLRAQNRIIVLSDSNSCIENVTLHIIPIQKTITASRVDPLYENWKTDYLNNLSTLNSRFCLSDGKLLLNIQYPIFPKPDSDPILYMNLVISNKSIIEILNGFSTDTDSELYFVCLDYNYLLSKNGSSSIPSEITDNIDNNKNGYAEVSYGNSNYLIAYSYIKDYNSILIYSTPLSKAMATTKAFGVIFFIFTLTSVSLAILYAFFLQKMVRKPFKTLVDALKSIEAGNLETNIHYEENDEFNYLYTTFNKTAKHLNELINQVYLQKIETQRAQLKQLQSQINPHFLYNSFFNISNMARINDNESIVKFTNYLGEYYQYITRNAASEVTLDKELDHARTYLEIQSMRFSDQISVEFPEYPKVYKTILVPRIIIQPIVENAFEHGLKNVSNPAIKISYEESNEYYSIIVSDNGPGMNDLKLEKLRSALNDTSKEIETSAIINIHRRLNIMYGKQSGISVSKDPFGFNVKISLSKDGIKYV